MAVLIVGKGACEIAAAMAEELEKQAIAVCETDCVCLTAPPKSKVTRAIAISGDLVGIEDLIVHHRAIALRPYSAKNDVRELQRAMWRKRTRKRR